MPKRPLPVPRNAPVDATEGGPLAQDGRGRRAPGRPPTEGPFASVRESSGMGTLSGILAWRRKMGASLAGTAEYWGVDLDELRAAAKELATPHGERRDELAREGADDAPDGPDEDAIQREIAETLTASREDYLTSRIGYAVRSRAVALHKGNLNSAKNYEQIIHRLRDQLDKERDLQRKRALAEGKEARPDPQALARKVLRNLPTMAAIAPIEANMALEALARVLGKRVTE